MKRKLPALAALAALLLCALGGAPALAAAVGGPMQTEVSINFEESIYFDRMQGKGGMDIDFGTHPLPLPGVSIQIPAAEDHTLRVRDGRLNAGGWTVHAKYSAPLKSDVDWNGAIVLYEPECSPSTGLTADLSNASVAPYLPDVKFRSFNTGQVLIAMAATGLTQGSYDLKYKADYVRLNVNASRATEAMPTTYSTTIIWELRLAP